jgi:hypothetical protein
VTPCNPLMFDPQGHLRLTPKQLFEAARTRPIRLVNDVLTAGTPAAFAEYERYCAFLDAVSKRLGVHPRNIFVRGSCHIGYSIAPKPKVWTAMSPGSDIDLAIVDAPYFHRVDDEVQQWEGTNRADTFQGEAFKAFVERRRDRQFNCCRDYRLPPAVCVHHQDTMSEIPVATFCEVARPLSAFIFKDWWSVRRRYEYDLRQLCSRVDQGQISPPGDEPTPAGPAPVVPPPPGAAV